MYSLLHDLRSSGFSQSCYPFGEFHHVVPLNNISTDEIENYLRNHHHQAVEIKQASANIEDCFLDLMTK